nr:hypothetical protein [Tanacetum cinerariifolium]
MYYCGVLQISDVAEEETRMLSFYLDVVQSIRTISGYNYAQKVNVVGIYFFNIKIWNKREQETISLLQFYLKLTHETTRSRSSLILMHFLHGRL